MKPKLKICGMKNNVAEVATVEPEYLGFIFYGGSPRNFEGSIPEIPSEIKKVGVFVDAELEEISEKIQTYGLAVVQLHGNESPEFCGQFKEMNDVEIWKVFSIKDNFDFERLIPYEPVVDKFLFDTKGKVKGGTGLTFDWEVLKDYSSAKPIVLSGGIGLEQTEMLKDILKTDLPIEILDVNSRFETAPGEKDVMKLEEFKKRLSL